MAKRAMRSLGAVLRRLTTSFRSRLILSFMTAIILTFAIMSTIFYGSVTRTLASNRASQLNAVAAELTILVRERLDSGADLTVDPFVAFYLGFIRRSLGSYVWLVQPDGSLLVATGIPDEAREQLLEQRDDGPPRLREAYIGERVDDMGNTFLGGNYLGLFTSPGGDRWISVIRPLRDADGALQMVIQLHDRFDMSVAARRYIIDGMGLAIFIAFLSALVIVIIFTNAVARPIRRLSEAAHDLMLGDFSVRVPWPDDGDGAGEDEDEPQPQADEIALLVRSFNRMAASLEHQNADRRDFISSISHDLRTPLTSISGFIEGMLDGTIPPERYPRYLGIVRDETQRLRALVNDMNEVNRLDGHALSYDFRSFDLAALVRGVIRSLESLISARRITVQLSQTSDGKPLMVVGDEEQLSRVFHNLIANALHFTPDEGVISVTWQRTPGAPYVEIAVEDSGPGIAEGDLPHIFERFYKSDRTRSQHRGSGLGLFICRSILQAHGQQISAGRSKMGGARFVFTLPLA